MECFSLKRGKSVEFEGYLIAYADVILVKDILRAAERVRTALECAPLGFPAILEVASDLIGGKRQNAHSLRKSSRNRFYLSFLNNA